MDFKSPFVKLLLDSVPDSKSKKLALVGVHDDVLVKELAPHFKKVCSFYEFLKVKEEEGGNFCIKKESFSKTLKMLGNFDVIAIMNEMHHFKESDQCAVYKNLGQWQTLILVEWAKKGNFERFYGCFQDCKPLCSAAEKVLKKAVEGGLVEIREKRLFADNYFFADAGDLRSFFKFILPDYYKQGEKAFEKKIMGAAFPLALQEENIFYKIRKARGR